MTALGLCVLRFTASEVYNALDGVLEMIRHALRESVLPDDPQKQWRYAGYLTVGDTVYFGIDRQPVNISAITHEMKVEEVYDLEVESAHSFLTNVCAVHNCGSGTTAYVSKQSGQRWINTSRANFVRTKDSIKEKPEVSLTISIPDDIANAIEDLAARSVMTPERLLLHALGAHFPAIPIELQTEFAALERASDEDYARFETAEQDFNAGSRFRHPAAWSGRTLVSD